MTDSNDKPKDQIIDSLYGFGARINPRFPGRGYELTFYRPIKDYEVDRGLLVTGMVCNEVVGFSEHPRGIILEGAIAQQIVDELWQCGIRPSEGTGSAGSLKATQDHLKDMQKLTDRNLAIVEHLLGKKGD